MRNTYLVALREYLENAKTKGFWIGIFMLPLILTLSVQVPIFLEKKGAPSRTFVLLDFSGEFERQILAAIEEEHERQSARNGNGPASDSRRLFTRVDVPISANSAEDAAVELRPYLRGEKKVSIEGRNVNLDSAIIIPHGITNQIVRPSAQKSAAESAAVQYWSANLADKSLRRLVENAINREVKRREYLSRGLDARVFQEIEQTRLPLMELNPKKEQGKEKVSKAEAIAQWAPVAFVYLLWISLFSISQMLLSNTIEEKSNRIIEVLLSSVTPAEFVLGKLAGIAAVGLTMIGAWLASFLLVLGWTTGGQSEIGREFLALLRNSNLMPAFVVYFFFGYLLYAGMILAIGSVCNTLKEAQNYMGVITVIMMVPLLTMMFIAKDPNGTLARVLSWIPIYTPFVMMNRAAADPPMYELLGTMAVLIAATAAVLWAAVKIFRLGILRTGQPPKIIEMLRWLRAN